MSELGPVGIGLSVAFAAFMAVLGFEVYYVWMSRQRRLGAGAVRRRAMCVEEAEVATPIAAEDIAVVQKRWAEVFRTLEKGRNWVFVEYRRATCLAKQLMASRHAAKLATPPVAEASLATSAARAGAGELTGCSEEGDEEDIFKLVGMWGGASRLLFTITEETKEDMEIEDAKSARGKSNSRRGSRASSELILVQSAATSPFHTPPSSPPFVTPFGSPDYNAASAAAAPSKASLESTSTSSSSSTTSSSPQHHRRPLSALFEETSSFTSSSATTSSAATPATLSPPPAPPLPRSPRSASPKRHRRTLGLLLDPPPSPSSSLYHYQHQQHNLYQQRVHPHPHPLSPPGFRYHRIEGNPCLSAAKLDPLPPHSPVSQSSPTIPRPPTFFIPDPPQPTTPCLLRPSSSPKPNGFLAYPSAP